MDSIQHYHYNYTNLNFAAVVELPRYERRGGRIGQEKLVHIWVLPCINSFADATINTGALQKLRVIDRIMAALRTAKGAEVEIPPHVPQFGKVSYIPYARYREMDAEAIGQEEEAKAKKAAEG